MSKKSNESYTPYNQKKYSPRIPSNNTTRNVNNNHNDQASYNEQSRSNNSIQLTKKGPYHALAQVLKNITPDAYNNREHEHEHEITVGVNQVYNGNCSASSSFRSGGTTSNDIGTTPN
jgi:hypothetical protein